MIISWITFIPIQIIILLFYFIKRKQVNTKYGLFPSKAHFLIGNTAILLTCILYNIEHQLFCNPVIWTSIILLIFSILFLATPFINPKSKFWSLIPFITGLGIFIAIYIILFSRYEYLFLVVVCLPFAIIFHLIIKMLNKNLSTTFFDAFYFYPAFILSPYLLLYQLWQIQKTYFNKIQKVICFSTPILVLFIGLIFTYRIKTIIDKITISSNKTTELKAIINNPIDYYLTELILGAHWKYHTELCLYDGYRPPFHDPILVIANKVLYPYSLFYTLNNDKDNLPNTIALYKTIFPEKSTDFKCRCAQKDKLFD